MAIVFPKSAVAAPLSLLVTEDGAGVEALAPTVALRDTATGADFDFADGTFKTIGWTLRDAPLSDLGRGRYERPLAIAATPALEPGMLLVAEFRADDTGRAGDDSELVAITATDDAVTLLRKLATNRLEETAGNPGALRLFDDDGSTILKTWPLRDENGGPVASSPGAPAKRGAAT
ncbi:MAG: hypothetical protein U0169_11025 [Polyangiaceae bacterium]